jgi:sugar phosphate isomerase/epimerase
MNVLTRRRFFRTSLGAPVVAALAGSLQRLQAAVVAAAQPGNRIGGFYVGSQCWTFNRFSVVEAIEMTAKAGGKVCEFYPGQKLSPEKPDQKWGHDAGEDATKLVRETCAKHGVTPMNYGVVGIPGDEKGARKIFEFARNWKLQGVTTESDKPIDLIAKLAEEYDVKVCYHNHPERKNDANYKVWNPKYIMELCRDRHPNVGACADTGHWVTSGLDPVECLRILKGRIHATHFKDRLGLGERTDQIFGKGKFAEAQLAELQAQGFSGNLSIEYETNWEKSLPDVTQCVEFIRATGQAKGWS